MTDRELMQQALMALEEGLTSNQWRELSVALRERLAQSEQEPVAWMTINEYGEEDDIHYENPEGHLLEGWTYKPLYTHPPSVQPVKLRRGDILRCIETDELCTVWSTSTTGKALVKWSANNFGDYTAEQIGELFWLEPKPEQEPVAWRWKERINNDFDSWVISASEPPPYAIEQQPLYSTPRPWVGLTDEEIEVLAKKHNGIYYDCDITFAQAIEAKLRSKNT